MKLRRPLSLAEKLVVVTIVAGVVHHGDHVLRADHYGFPFKPQVTLYTATLLLYVLFASVLWARSRPWYRVGAIGVALFFTVFAHVFIEPPYQQYRTWAENVSYPAPLFTPDGSKNMLGVESPLLGFLSVLDTMILQAALAGALWLFIVEARRARAARNSPTSPGRP